MVFYYIIRGIPTPRAREGASENKFRFFSEIRFDVHRPIATPPNNDIPCSCGTNYVSVMRGCKRNTPVIG